MEELPGTIRLHGMDLDPAAREVVLDGQPIALTKTEFGLLYTLAQNAGMACERQQIIAAAHGADYPATERTVDVQITALRKKLGTRRTLIETVRGVGYRLRAT